MNNKMRNRFFSVLGFAGIVLCVILGCAACSSQGNNQSSQGEEQSSQVEDNLSQDEANCWQALEEELVKYYGDLAMVANWGDEAATINADKAKEEVAKLRNEDLAELRKDGKFAECELSISDARGELVREMEDANSLGEDAVDDPQFKETLQDMKQRGENVIQLLDKWIEARAALSQSQQIPDAHTAHVIEQLAQRIQMMIEG